MLSTCFICIIPSKRKQTMEQQPHRACELTKSSKKKKVTSHSNWPRVLLFELVHKQCNSIIKRWLHYLMSDSKERFLANNILLAWCLVMPQIQFSVIKNIKIGRPEHLIFASPTPPNAPPSLLPVVPLGRFYLSEISLLLFGVIWTICLWLSHSYVIPSFLYSTSSGLLHTNLFVKISFGTNYY